MDFLSKKLKDSVFKCLSVDDCDIPSYDVFECMVIKVH